MSSHYPNIRPGPPHANGSYGSLRTLLGIFALIVMGASAVYWWSVQSQLTENWLVALAYTVLLVLVPPSLVSFLIPWSPAGMLLQKLNARIWLYPVVIGCLLSVFYLSFSIQGAWWAMQPVMAKNNLVYPQALFGIIGFTIIPALLWISVASEQNDKL